MLDNRLFIRYDFTCRFYRDTGFGMLTEDPFTGESRHRNWTIDQEVHLAMKTYVAKAGELEKKWYVIDAEGKTLGRLATEVAMLLSGKKKPEYTPFLDTGDYVIVVNAEKVTVTGKKYTDKLYRHHTGYPGGLKETNFKTLLAKHPTYAVEYAVKGMLPKNSLGRAMFKKLKVVAGPEHKYAAQKPEVYEF